MKSSEASPRIAYAALVLAGRRGPDDPLAAAAGAPHRALLDVGGVPTLQRVIDTLLDSDRITRLVVSIDVPSLLDSVPGIATRLREDTRLSVIQSAGSPSRSVLEGLSQFAAGEAVLVTAADHALLDRPMLEQFLQRAEQSGADLTLAMVPATLLRARFPESKRTYLPLRGESYSGANLFLFRTEASRRVAEFWTKAEGFRKQPWKLVSFFGVTSLLLFALRRLDLDAAMARASQTIGARVRAVELDIAEAAIDVDSVADWKLANRIVAEREARSR